MLPLTSAQYANLAAVLGRVGPNGLNTVYVEDVRAFYETEDLPPAYQRRELPYFSVEANDLTDRMTHHVGFQIVRPFPEGDGFGKWSDVEPVVAPYEAAASGAVVASALTAKMSTE